MPWGKEKKYVIGVDGGGTKTTAALADLRGRILAQSESGPSNLRNLGIDRAVENIQEGIAKVTATTKATQGEILTCFVGLAAVTEEYQKRTEEIKKMLTEATRAIRTAKVIIGSDQLVAFRSGTDEKNGVVLIAGTGAACHGWWKGKEAKTSGWGWLDDEGSGFWVGQKAFQAALKACDRRGPKTLLADLLFQQLQVSNREELLKGIYQSGDLIRSVSLLSIAVDKAAQKEDRVAQAILKAAARELILSYQGVIRKLAMEKEVFPLVAVGKMFKSKIILREVKKGVQEITPKVKLIKPRAEPVTGAIKLALEQARTV